MANKLIELRKLMKENNIDAYIITKFDPHQTEYADSYYNATQFISNFTGSNATIVVTDLEAGLWTDNRYFLQAEKELGEEFTLHKMGEKGTIDVLDFASKYKTIGIDFSTYPAEAGKKLEQKIKKSNVVSSANGNLIDIDLISPLWQNREFAKRDGIFLFRDDKEESLYLSKINQVRSLMKTPYYIISSLDDIAWVLNIRALGEFNTFNFLAYLFIEPKNIILFIDSISGGGNNIGDVFPEGLEIKPYSEVFDYIKNKTSGTISIAPARTNYKIYKAVQNPNILKHDITTTLKARKDEQEINLIKEANIADAILHVKFYKWLEENGAGNTEYEIGEKLYSMRMEHGAKNHSFPPIIGYLENGAIVHYRAEKDYSKVIQNKGFLLIDSGANYSTGTTDITRTIAMGALSEEEKNNYTYVLKAHIALALQKFPQGTSGIAIDAITRKPLWDVCLNYGHGTGHGIGHFLNVHEGPCNISPRGTEPLEAGNVLSNEPGLYITGKYGIRLENTVLVKNSEHSFLQFETLSFIPFERNAINENLLTECELAWLNDYHKKTYELLENHLTEDEKKWLEKATKIIF